MKEEINNKFLDESGQSVFEFVIFIPFILYIVAVMMNAGNAINASINQQKATRGYAFRLLSGNSNVPTVTDLDIANGAGLVKTSTYIIGWGASKEGDVYHGACYKFPSMPGDGLSDSEDCKNPIPGQTKTAYVRAYTFFGICGESYVKEGAYYRRDYIGRARDICTYK